MCGFFLPQNSYNENEFEIPVQHQNGSGYDGRPGNLSELDMLLEDLSNARYNNQSALQKSKYKNLSFGVVTKCVAYRYQLQWNRRIT